jgi:hypothetical protein
MTTLRAINSTHFDSGSSLNGACQLGLGYEKECCVRQEREWERERVIMRPSGSLQAAAVLVPVTVAVVVLVAVAEVVLVTVAVVVHVRVRARARACVCVWCTCLTFTLSGLLFNAVRYHVTTRPIRTHPFCSLTTHFRRLTPQLPRSVVVCNFIPCN